MFPLVPIIADFLLSISGTQDLLILLIQWVSCQSNTTIDKQVLRGLGFYQQPKYILCLWVQG